MLSRKLKQLRKAEGPPPSFSEEEWKLVSSFNITRTTGIRNSPINLKYFEASLHNCVETILVDEAKYGLNNFVRVSIFRFKKRPQVSGCEITVFGQTSPVAVLVGFGSDHLPALI